MDGVFTSRNYVAARGENNRSASETIEVGRDILHGADQIQSRVARSTSAHGFGGWGYGKTDIDRLCSWLNRLTEFPRRQNANLQDPRPRFLRTTARLDTTGVQMSDWMVFRNPPCAQVMRGCRYPYLH